MDKKLISLSALIILLSLPFFVLAIDVSKTFQPAPNQQLDPADLINRVLNWIVWPIAVGTIIILFILAGLIFLTGQGDPGKMAEARRAFAWGVVGVIVILISFSIIATVKWLVTG